jgi:hypothetical protein
MSEDTLIAIVAIACAVGGPLLVGMVAIVMSHWQKVRVAEQQTILKRELLDRGFTAEEIVRVIEAGGAEAEDKPGKPARCH